MTRNQTITYLALITFFVSTFASCGSSSPQPKDGQDTDEEFDLVGSIVGDVEPEEIEEEEEALSEDYTGPTALTVNLKVVNDKNPKGSFRLLDAAGKAIIENGKLGEPNELNQGTYTVEFKSPLVHGDPTFVVEDVQVAGKKMEITEVFPAGQITLHSFRGKNQGRCVPVTFSVKSETLEKDLPGKAKTCKPVILEAGSYELLFDISKKKVQPVKMQVNAEQVSTAPVKLEGK